MDQRWSIVYQVWSGRSLKHVKVRLLICKQVNLIFFWKLLFDVNDLPNCVYYLLLYCLYQALEVVQNSDYDHIKPTMLCVAY